MVNIRLKDMHLWPRPGSCLLCAAHLQTASDVCPACANSLPRLQWACARCAAHGAVVEVQGPVCGACQKQPPAYTSTRAAFRYAAPVDKLIHQLKYHGRLELSRVLGGYLAEQLKTLSEPPPDVIVPVPLHPSRLRERGYNQSLELARFVARAMQRPVNWKDAQRIRATAPQTELPRDQRRQNVRGAFKTDEVFANQRVAVVDDVMTSGHTVNALAECLLHSGASDVRIWVLARA